MNYATVLQIVQLTLADKRARLGRALLGEEIEAEVTAILDSPVFSKGIDRETLIRDLEERFNIWQDDAQILQGMDDHQGWLSARRADIQWPLWQRYKLFIGSNLPPDALDNLEKVTDEVLGHLEDPTRTGAWDRRGLVMGHVQSGKTASYVGLICKAADAGYKVIVVLAGLHNNLRSQTQIRLDEGFLGYRSVAPVRGGAAFERTGVGLIDPKPRVDSVTNRADTGDFKRSSAQNFGIHPGGNPLLFVVKKNVSVLKNLLAWISGSADGVDPDTGRRFHRDVPLLVIDDEADQASVDTRAGNVDEDGTPDEEHNPTRINELVRRLLIAFEKSAYVGYTATPFANIFIHDQGFTKELGEDLFPRSFIVSLSPPSNYAGAARVFGIRDAGHAGLTDSEGLPIYRPVDDHADSTAPDETAGWMPPKLVGGVHHIPLTDGHHRVPHSLREAMLSFLLSTTVRHLREAAPIFNSMLVHVVRYQAVQIRVGEQIQRELDDIRQRLVFGDGDRQPTIRDELKALWDGDFVETSAACGTELPRWEDVIALAPKVAKGIVLKTINGSAKDILDYEDHKESGLDVIVIGGDKLSRGLTLEGLTVSYFLRASRMYDTLMQMGRWFGYREKYLDLCRLYTTEELRSWFAYIAAATEELRLEFDYMSRIGATPRDFGLKVRAHPALMITAAVKMRSGTSLRLSFAGDISETIIFDVTDGTLLANRTALEWLLGQLPQPTSGSRTGGYLWRDVKVEKILGFLERYRSHPDAIRANTALLGRYVTKQNEQGELTEWNVFLASSNIGNDWTAGQPLCGGPVGMNERAQYPANADEKSRLRRYTIRRLVNPTDEAIDLDDDQCTRAVETMQSAWRASTRKNKSPEPPTAAAGRATRAVRDKKHGLLIIYPLDPKNASRLTTQEAVLGIALSFPESDTAKDIEYKVTNLFAVQGEYDNL